MLSSSIIKPFGYNVYTKIFFCSKGKFCLEWFSFLCFLSFSFPQWWRSKPRLRKLGEHSTVELHPPINFQPLMHLPASSSSFCFLFFLGFSLVFNTMVFLFTYNLFGIRLRRKKHKQPSLKSWKQTQRSLFHVSSSAFTIHDTRADDWWILVPRAK